MVQETETRESDSVKKFRVESADAQDAINSIPFSLGEPYNKQSPFTTLQKMNANRVADGVFEIVCVFEYKPPVWVEHIEDVGENYKLTIRRRDDSSFCVLIPVEVSDSFENRCVSGGGEFGLNLVSEGHYT